MAEKTFYVLYSGGPGLPDDLYFVIYPFSPTILTSSGTSTLVEGVYYIKAIWEGKPGDKPLDSKKFVEACNSLEFVVDTVEILEEESKIARYIKE